MGRDRTVQVEVLGPLRVLAPDGTDLTPDGRLQRRLLALMVLARGRAVSSDSAIDALWPTGLPHDPTGALQNHVSRLRRVLPAGALESVGSGDRLDPGAVDVDVDRFAGALRGATDQIPLTEIDAVLERWQGPAYAELLDTDDGRAESARLDEVRVRAREVRAAARLGRGDTNRLVDDLSALAEEHPLRERPRELLMAALAATGRRVDALRVFDDFRRMLADEVGTEPSPLLAAQHSDLLSDAADQRAPRSSGALADVAWAPPSRLPTPPTSLVGRKDFIDELMTLVQEHRMVTMVGPGGVGKTRLLLEIGHRIRADAPERSVVFCELASSDDSTAVAAVAAALGIDARPGVPPVERVVAVLGATAVTVLLDNCEHVLAPVATLASQVLAHCPNVSVVATTRERLRVEGEQVRAVPSLPAADQDSAAVQLFVERARAVAAGFAPTGDDLRCVAEIVRRLDGLPLAIELAAARLFTHDLQEVAAGLDHRFSLLTSGPRVEARHGSLSAAVSWSFSVLDDQLRACFSALSAFAGPFTTADAAAVCGIDEPAATDALVELTERSLVMRVPGRGFVLLETLRAYGAEHLDRTGATDAVRARHAHHFVRWAETADHWFTEPGRTAIGAIDATVPELRAALAWLLDHGDVERAGRLVVALLDYCIMRLRPDVLAWSEQVAAADPGDDVVAAPVVWVAAAYAAWMAGDLETTGGRSNRALAVAERSGGDLPAEVATMQGNDALFEGRLDDALAWYDRATALALTQDDPNQRLMASCTALLVLGYSRHPEATGRATAILAEVGDSTSPYAAYAWYCAGESALSDDPGLARARYVRALEVADLSDASFVTGIAGASKASIDARSGDPIDAADQYRWLLDHWRRAGMWSTQWTMLRSVAGLLFRLGRHRDAAILAGAVRSTAAGHRIFGDDEVALLELDDRLRSTLDVDVYTAAMTEGGRLDGDAAVEHALRAL